MKRGDTTTCFSGDGKNLVEESSREEKTYRKGYNSRKKGRVRIQSTAFIVVRRNVMLSTISLQNRTKPILGMLAAHMGTGSCPRCSITSPVPSEWYGKSNRVPPKYSDPCCLHK